MRNLQIAVLASLLTACATQPNSEQHQAVVAGLDQVSASQAEVLTQCQALGAGLEQQAQQLEQMQTQLTGLAAATGTAAAATPAASCPQSKGFKLGNRTVLGEAEWVTIGSVKMPLSARVDTGAKTSSLNAQDIVRFERDGKTWVRFGLSPAKDQPAVQLEAPVVRYADVLQSNSEKPERRPVISMILKVGDISEQTQFTLADRSHLTYPVLLGRNFLKDIAVVDISGKYTQAKPSFEDQN